ncbi:sodium:calcium antiporter [Patescibacteria group bacterium]|nr:sodium:calcium antiporter [Patescibacteria group bacterium]
MVYLFFVLGLIGLWLGADTVIRGALGIARYLKMSETFIGATIVALSTALPELIVSITGAIEQRAGLHTSGLVIGNIMGSAMGQMSLILGIAGLLKVLDIRKKEIISNGGAMIASILGFWFLAQDGIISPTDGLFLLCGYVLYLFLLSNNEHKITRFVNKYRFRKKKIVKKFHTKQMWRFIGEFVAGLIIVTWASRVVLTEGLVIAQLLNMSQVLVGIIMVGVGTSLPELVVSVSAIMKGSSGLSVGNLIGSSIVSILLALGLSSTIGGWVVPRSITTFDLPFLMVTSIIVMLFLITRAKLERKESLLALALYYGYIVLKLQGF